jgi:hypothetical protein
MNFEVNGTRYFLSFSAGEGRWQLLMPTATGIARMPIADDNPPVTGTKLWLDMAGEQPKG